MREPASFQKGFRWVQITALLGTSLYRNIGAIQASGRPAVRLSVRPIHLTWASPHTGITCRVTFFYVEILVQTMWSELKKNDLYSIKHTRKSMTARGTLQVSTRTRKKHCWHIFYGADNRKLNILWLENPPLFHRVFFSFMLSLFDT